MHFSMSPEERQWHIDQVKYRYTELDLTFGQAEKILDWEAVDFYDLDGITPSFWEERDAELVFFRTILNENQREIFEKSVKEHIGRHEQNLVEEDENRGLASVHFNEELLQFYREILLPDLEKRRFFFKRFYPELAAKEAYLQQEYSRWVRLTEKRIYLEHAQQSRNFQPNKLKASFLEHHRNQLYPNYESFKRHMDEPTRQVAKFIVAKWRTFNEELETLLREKQTQFYSVHNTLYEAHFGKPDGSILVIESTEEQDQEDRRMKFLLLKPGGY